MFFIFTPTPGEMGWLKPPPNSDTLILTTSKLRTEVPCFFSIFRYVLPESFFAAIVSHPRFFPVSFCAQTPDPLKIASQFWGKTPDAHAMPEITKSVKLLGWNFGRLGWNWGHYYENHLFLRDLIWTSSRTYCGVPKKEKSPVPTCIFWAYFWTSYL